MEITKEQIAKITNAANVEQASCFAGEIEQAHFVKMEYIKAILGKRACSGFFNPTIANVKAKFIKAWNIAQEK